jgi:hypothetical protein
VALVILASALEQRFGEEGARGPRYHASRADGRGRVQVRPHGQESAKRSGIAPVDSEEQQVAEVEVQVSLLVACLVSFVVDCPSWTFDFLGK